jgi:UDP-N-acetylglucosamine/UDP-N-acetylgalactosamine diphosphorylase
MEAPKARIRARIRARVEAAGQTHLLSFAGDLDRAARERLLAQIEGIDFGLTAELARLAANSEAASHTPEFAPPEVFPIVRRGEHAARAKTAIDAGADLLRRGKVGYLLVAGGQASRLGYDGPKGMFPVGPVTGQSLFELFARRMQAARERFGAPIWWYILTSAANDATTRAFFAEQRFFGLDPESVFFFRQAMLPALDREGRVLMSARDEVFLAPNGHGGVLSALAESGGLAHARARGVELFSYFQVDNPLARPADPLFLGLHALERAEMSTKVVAKRNAGEKVGVIGRIDGKLSCIEYSDLPSHLREARSADGELVYRAGNIALHVIDLEFIDRLTRGGLKLPWHIARKRMSVIDRAGRPAQVDGYKFETFVFDALQSARASVTLEVDRKLEFSPVKNAQGEDSPASTRADLCNLYADWIQRAGLVLPAPGDDGVVPVEVDPRVAEDLETFVARTPRTPRITARGHVYQ